MLKDMVMTKTNVEKGVAVYKGCLGKTKCQSKR